MIFNTHYPYIGGGGGKPSFTYTGQYTEVDDGGGNWRIKFLTSGTLTLKNKITVDVFLVGGGGGGRSASSSGGGGGGYTHTERKMEIKPGSYPVVIGAGGAADSDGNPSTFNGLSANGGGAAYKSDASYGGNGGSGGGLWGNGGSDGGNGSSRYDRGGKGQGTTTREFGESTGDLYAGGGGGSSTSSQTYPGGAGGGGNGGGNITAGTPNTGGGGGAGNLGVKAAGGGSGIVIIRNAR